MLLLAAKLVLAPACVVATSLAARRWGARAGGLLGGLPVVAGPILLVIAAVHGGRFGGHAAAATLLGMAALVTFVVVYGWMATRFRWSASVLAGWASFLLVVAALDPVALPLGATLAAMLGVFALGSLLLPRLEHAVVAEAVRSRWDLPLRAGAALALVVTVTTAAGTLGPHLSGLLTPFPIITSVLAVFTHAQSGTAQLEALLRGFLLGFCSYAVFCFALALALPKLSVGAAFAIAIAAALATQAAVVAAAELRLRMLARSARSQSASTTA
jgi:hypothetical protein